MKKARLKERLAAAEYRGAEQRRRVSHLENAIEDVFRSGTAEEQVWACHVLGRSVMQMHMAVEMRAAYTDLANDLSRQLFGPSTSLGA